MSDVAIMVISLIIMFVIMLGGSWIFVGLGATGYLALMFAGGMQHAVASRIWESMDNFTLASIPMFILLGEIILNSGMAKNLYSGVSKWASFLPGGLLHTNIAAAAIFAAISGSSVATCATIGTMATKEEIGLGYDRKLIMGTVIGAGTLGILIPPSINMIIYASWVQCSMGQLFIGGIVPGLMLALLFMSYVGIRAIMDPSLAPKPKAATWGERLIGLKEIAPSALLILFILVGIYSGFATPTEIASVGAVFAIILAIVLRKFSWSMLSQSILNTARLGSILAVIYLGAQILTLGALRTGVPMMLPMWVAGLHLPTWGILVIIYVIYLILGCFFDGISMLVVSLPFILPILISLNINLLWFGVTYIILAEMGFLTPPVGLNLYIMLGILPDSTLDETVVAAIPFFLIMGVMLVLITIFPDIILWLPSTMK
jgi:tripartite ATP-independent transporter DctM subunit